VSPTRCSGYHRRLRVLRDLTLPRTRLCGAVRGERLLDRVDELARSLNGWCELDFSHLWEEKVGYTRHQSVERGERYAYQDSEFMLDSFPNLLAAPYWRKLSSLDLRFSLIIPQRSLRYRWGEPSPSGPASIDQKCMTGNHRCRRAGKVHGCGYDVIYLAYATQRYA